MVTPKSPPRHSGPHPGCVPACKDRSGMTQHSTQREESQLLHAEDMFLSSTASLTHQDHKQGRHTRARSQTRHPLLSQRWRDCQARSAGRPCTQDTSGSHRGSFACSTGSPWQQTSLSSFAPQKTSVPVGGTANATSQEWHSAPSCTGFEPGLESSSGERRG